MSKKIKETSSTTQAKTLEELCYDTIDFHKFMIMTATDLQYEEEVSAEVPDAVMPEIEKNNHQLKKKSA